MEAWQKRPIDQSLGGNAGEPESEQHDNLPGIELGERLPDLPVVDELRHQPPEEDHERRDHEHGLEQTPPRRARHECGRRLVHGALERILKTDRPPIPVGASIVRPVCDRRRLVGSFDRGRLPGVAERFWLRPVHPQEPGSGWSRRRCSGGDLASFPPIRQLWRPSGGAAPPCHHERVTLAAGRNLDEGWAALRADDEGSARHTKVADLAASHIRLVRAGRPGRAGRRSARPRQEFPGGGSP